MHRSPALFRSILISPLILASVCPGADEAAATATAAAAFDWRAFLAPFHTVTLHLPIGFVTVAVILECYALIRPSEPLRRAISLILWVSGVSAVVVTLLGLFRAGGGGYEEEMLRHHEQYGIAVAVVTGVVALVHSVAYRAGATRSRVMAALYRLLLVADMGLLVIAGHGGGNLTHGSKYLVEGAPDWVKVWLETTGKQAPDTGTASGSVPAAGTFAERIRPVFEKKCFSCHGAEKQKGDYRMDTAEGLFAAGESELDPIVAGRPLDSYLVELILLPGDDEDVMPPEGKERLTPEEILAIIQWIGNGARVE